MQQDFFSHPQLLGQRGLCSGHRDLGTGPKTSLWAARGAEQEVDRLVDVYLARPALGPVMAHSRYLLKVS